jgi:putative membrane protein
MMMRKRIFLLLMTFVLILPSFLVHASTNEKETLTTPGQYRSKDEVVYATLSPAGVQQEIYVVNIFDVLKEGKLVDYGPYESSKNLTDLSEIKLKNNKVEFAAPKGKFYYQGNMKDEALPWDIRISYRLDGKRIPAAELAGKDGHLKLDIQTSANEEVDQVFYENYLLQVTLTLDPEIYSNIKASEDGMVANAGKNKQITYTVMPEKDGDLSLEADVVDLELQGIEIAAVPSSMSIDAPDIDEMTGEMESLTDAIAQIHNGVGDLKNGVSELNSGVASLRDGSAKFKKGMSDVDQASSQLVEGSSAINSGLATVSSSLKGNFEQIDLAELEKLQGRLPEIAAGLNEAAKGFAYLRENYSEAYRKIEEAIKNIPEYEITEAEMEQLYASGADREIVDQLFETYSAAHQAKDIFATAKESFEAVDGRLAEVNDAIAEIEKTLATVQTVISTLEDVDVVDSITQLQEGMDEFSASYQAFHSGLVGYTKGVGQLSSSYNKLHSGIVDLSGGTNELENGVGELHNGTGTLYEATNNLPDQMKDEIDSMISQYDKSDFEAVSFVSDKNEKVNSVQFVIKTESILLEEKETTEKPEEEPKGFWARLKELFS